MTFSLYDATIPSTIQVSTAVAGLLDKAIELCADKKISEQELINARLAEDMFPFAYQISSVSQHSIGAIEGVRNGVFSPNLNPPPTSFGDLKKMTEESIKALSDLEPAEINGFLGRDMRFQFGEYVMNFTAENFLLSFSQPNFYFHATTAYDILRLHGADIGKRDFMGAARVKP